MHLSVIDFYSYHESVTAALDAVSAGETLAKQKSILLKPKPHLSADFRYKPLQGSLQTAAK